MLRMQPDVDEARRHRLTSAPCGGVRRLTDAKLSVRAACVARLPLLADFFAPE